MESAYIIVGLLFIFAISLLIITFCITHLVNLWKQRKDQAYSEWATGVCSQVERWCSYEYPQVGYSFNKLSNCIANHWSFDADNFREDLRRKFPKDKETK